MIALSLNCVRCLRYAGKTEKGKRARGDVCGQSVASDSGSPLSHACVCMSVSANSKLLLVMVSRTEHSKEHLGSLLYHLSLR